MIALPPDKGVELADVESVLDERFISLYIENINNSVLPECDQSSPRTDSVGPEVSTFATVAIRIDTSSVLHPFSQHKMDTGPVRLMTISHAFIYRMAVLRDGVKSAVRVGRSRKPEGCFLACC